VTKIKKNVENVLYVYGEGRGERREEVGNSFFALGRK